MRWKKTLAFGLIGLLALLAVPLPAHGEEGRPAVRTLSIWYGNDGLTGVPMAETYRRNAWEMDALFASQTYGGRRLADHRLLEGTTAPALLEAIREAFEDGKEEDLNIIYYSGLADTLNGDTSALTLGGTYGTGLDLLLPQAFYGLLEELPGSFLVILDCDYAGGFLPPNPIVPSSNSVTLLEGMEDEREHSPVEAKVSVLYGVERDETALAGGTTPMGVFTRLLTGAGRGGVASKGEVTTLGELGAYLKQANRAGQVGWIGEESLPLWCMDEPDGLQRLGVSSALGGSWSLAVMPEVSRRGTLRYEIYPKERYLSALEPGGLQDRWVQQSGTLVVEPQGDPQSIALNRRLATGNYILRAQLDDGLYREAEFSITRAFAGTPKIALTAEQSFAPRPGGTLSIGVAFSRGEETISPCNISLWVEDSSGRRVRTLAQEELSVFRLDGKTGRVKGENRYRWDGKDDGGNPLPAGNYYLRARGDFGGGAEPEASARVELTRIQMGLTVLGRKGEGLSGAELLLNGISLGETDSSGHLDFSAYGGYHALTILPREGPPFVAQLRLARSGELTLRLFSGDGFLAFLSVQSPSGEELLAGFDPMEAEYRLVVPVETEVVTIDAMAAHQRAVVFGLGKAELGEPGSVTVIPVLVMAEDGSQLLYRISVLRQLEEGDPEEEELLDGEREELPPRLWWEEYPQGILLRFQAREGGEEQAVGLFAMEDLSPKALLRVLEWRQGHCVRETLPGVFHTGIEESDSPAILHLEEEIVGIPEPIPARLWVARATGELRQGTINLNQVPSITGVGISPGEWGAALRFSIDGEGPVTVEVKRGEKWRIACRKVAEPGRHTMWVTYGGDPGSEGEPPSAIRVCVGGHEGSVRCKTIPLL